MTTQNKTNINGNIAIYFIILIIFLAIPISIYYCKFHEFGISNDQEIFGQFGDFIGGISNLVIGLGNIVATIYLAFIISNFDKERYEEQKKLDKERFEELKKFEKEKAENQKIQEDKLFKKQLNNDIERQKNEMKFQVKIFERELKETAFKEYSQIINTALATPRTNLDHHKNAIKDLNIKLPLFFIKNLHIFKSIEEKNLNDLASRTMRELLNDLDTIQDFRNVDIIEFYKPLKEYIQITTVILMKEIEDTTKEYL